MNIHTMATAWLSPALLLAATGASARAATSAPALSIEPKSGEQTYCGSAQHHALDFMLGEWLVYEKGQLMHIDQVEKDLRGCTILMRDKWVSDKYRAPGQSFRFEGLSMIAFARGQWTMFAADVMGGAFVMKANVIGPEAVEFLATEPRGSTYIKATMERVAGGDLRMLGFTSPNGETGWKPFFEYIYKPNR